MLTMLSSQCIKESLNQLESSTIRLSAEYVETVSPTNKMYYLYKLPNS